MGLAVGCRWRHVYRWDLDKTYLESHFETLSRLVRIAMESPEDKVNVPGSAALLRELCRERLGLPESRVAIVSGSPRQMREVLEQKLRLDGIQWHEFHLKPQLANLRRGRFRALREQVGYKLPLLLRSRVGIEGAVGETLFGDDAEADAFVYSLYADLISGKVEEEEMMSILKRAGAYGDAIKDCRRLLPKVRRADPVEQIFIHLDTGRPPASFDAYGPRVVPIFNYFQAALLLFARGHLDPPGVVAVTEAFLEAEEHEASEMGNLFQDLRRRGFLPGRAMEELGSAIAEAGGERGKAVTEACERRFRGLGPKPAVRNRADLGTVDYLALVDSLRDGG